MKNGKHIFSGEERGEHTIFQLIHKQYGSYKHWENFHDGKKIQKNFNQKPLVRKQKQIKLKTKQRIMQFVFFLFFKFE